MITCTWLVRSVPAIVMTDRCMVHSIVTKRHVIVNNAVKFDDRVNKVMTIDIVDHIVTLTI